MEILFDELQRLEITKANKVDHPPGGSKDVADAVCGAVYMAIEKSGGEIGMIQSDSAKLPETEPTPNNTSLAQKKELDAKSKHYQQLQEMLDAGLIQ